MSDLAEILPMPVPLDAPWRPTPMGMLERAVESGASIEVLTKLMDLQERHERNQARRAFGAAVAAAKAEIGPATFNATGHNNKRYANFAAYAAVVDPVISRHGLFYRFRTTQTDKINVTCVLEHRGGHYEENTLSGPSDKTGAKNDIQAIGSTLSYLQRYSLIQALGLSSAEDDDGMAVGRADNGTVSDEQRDRLLALIAEVQGDVAKFCAFFKIGAVAELPAADFRRAVTMLEAKRSRG